MNSRVRFSFAPLLCALFAAGCVKNIQRVDARLNQSCALGAKIVPQPVRTVSGYPIKMDEKEISAEALQKFKLPPSIHEFTDAELYARWGNDFAREIRITSSRDVQPCDPVGPNDCHQDTSAIVECKLLSTSLMRETVRSPEGIRRVVRIVNPSSTHSSRVFLESEVACTDVVTGEVLPGLCGP